MSEISEKLNDFYQVARKSSILNEEGEDAPDATEQLEALEKYKTTLTENTEFTELMKTNPDTHINWRKPFDETYAKIAELRSDESREIEAETNLKNHTISIETRAEETETKF